MGVFGKTFSFSGSPRPAATTTPLNIKPKVVVGQGTSGGSMQKSSSGPALRISGKCPTCR